MVIILLAPLGQKTQNATTECDCPPTIFKTTILGNHFKNNFNSNFITLFNVSTIIIPANTYKNIYFKNLILTSLPTECIIGGCKYLYAMGLLCEVKKIASYNSLFIKVFNKTNTTLTLTPHQFQCYCLIVLSGHFIKKIDKTCQTLLH